MLIIQRVPTRPGLYYRLEAGNTSFFKNVTVFELQEHKNGLWPINV